MPLTMLDTVNPTLPPGHSHADAMSHPGYQQGFGMHMQINAATLY
jgi:hypothetical protein